MLCVDVLLCCVCRCSIVGFVVLPLGFAVGGEVVGDGGGLGDGGVGVCGDVAWCVIDVVGVVFDVWLCCHDIMDGFGGICVVGGGVEVGVIVVVCGAVLVAAVTVVVDIVVDERGRSCHWCNRSLCCRSCWVHG